MGGLFGAPKAPKVTVPDPPKARRMPVYSDPNIQEKGRMIREKFRRRKGAASTLLSDSLNDDGGLSLG